MKLPSGNVQETLFVPLSGRSFTTMNYPDLLDDPESVRIVNETKYDFSRIDTSREYDRNKGLIFIAGGVFYYFEEDRDNDFIKAVAERFPGSRMIFDGSFKDGKRIQSSE